MFYPDRQQMAMEREIMIGRGLHIPEFDTPSDSQVSISIDVGIVPKGCPGATKYIITIQAWPLTTRRDADIIAQAMREAIGSRLGISFFKQEGVG